jgi:inosine-uridine nucleoside N-ribohydrolase
MLGVMPGEGTIGARHKVILDCDPGHDDAVAIIVAAHRADLCGIVTVDGNAPIEQTTHNALVMRDLLGLDVPVHRGAERPLVAEPRHAAFIHGDSGLDGAELPDPTTPLDGDRGAEFIVETCRSVDDVWLVPVGPLTNIATALRLDPDLADRIAGVSLMGGGTFGNRSAVAEFNIWADPEAAAIVFDAAADRFPLTMAGLDVTHRLQATPERIEAVRAIPGTLATVLADLFTFFSSTYLERHASGAMRGAALHDPLAVLAVTDPHLFERRRHHVVVETAGEFTRGMTVIDVRHLRDMPEPNCDVLVDVDADAAFDLVVAAIEAGSGA